MNAKMCQRCVKNVNDKYYKLKKDIKQWNNEAIMRFVKNCFKQII